MMDIARTQGGVAEPVKIVLHLHARSGAREPLEAWIRALLAAAARSAELVGSSVLTAGHDEYIVLLRFTGQDQLERWESSPEIRSLLHRGEGFTEGREQPIRRTGFETWFTLPGVPAPATAPPLWKMALVTWLSLLPQVIALSFVIPASWPLLVNIALSTAIPVSMLTWVVMPWLTRLLYGWLYAPVTSRAPVLPSGGGSPAA